MSNALYDPHTLITRIIPEDPAGLGEEAHIRQIMEFNATVVHERVHWLQHHGTSFGCFLSALRSSQQGTAIRNLKDQPRDIVRGLLQSRASDGIPILRLDAERQYPLFDDGDGHEEMDVIRQMWYDHQWLYAAFEDSSAIEKTSPLPGSAIGEVIADVLATLAVDSKVQCTLRDEFEEKRMDSRKWFAVPDERINFVTMNGMRLTSKLLMEATATIAELRILPLSIWKDILGPSPVRSAIHARLRTIVEGNYGVPIRSLLQVLSLDLTALPKVLPTVSAICYAALNPPLPPYVMGPPLTKASWQWHELYPPMRFGILAKAVRSVGLLTDCLNHDVIANYISDLCDVAGLPSVIEMSYPTVGKTETTPNFNDPNQDYSLSLKSLETKLVLDDLPG